MEGDDVYAETLGEGLERFDVQMYASRGAWKLDLAFYKFVNSIDLNPHSRSRVRAQNRACRVKPRGSLVEL